MQFNLKFMREFFKVFYKTDNLVEENDDPNFTSLEIGEIHVLTPKGMIKFPFHVTEDNRQTINSAWMVKLVDSGFMVLFHLDYFMRALSSYEMNDLYAVVAHEIGHYLAGHFDNPPNKNLDVKPEVQEFFIKQYHAAPNPQTEMRYFRALFFSLLRGGANIAELEADMMALRFVPLANLVLIHSQDFVDSKNPFTVLEKVNRIKRLNKHAETHEFDSQGYSLLIKLYDMTKPKDQQKAEVASLPTEVMTE